ncbi:response regulator [Bremerella alba]|uniref:Regulator of RpoS n=1 Tax=Bremerella alba TaxID=980252 RepID=A0A7V8V970_9BACT|nr:response regulator [Bremerella alba]MBA2117243.1 Regulator of RpoS [Bremerella alba]
MIADAIPQMEELTDLEVRGDVLICDDEPDICEALAHFVKKRGFDPIVTHKGNDCIRLALQQRPMAILLDVNLPDSNGLDVCSQLTDAVQTSQIPVIILSANGGDDMIRQSRRSGARFYVRKPYDPNTVVAILEQAVNDAQAW